MSSGCMVFILLFEQEAETRLMDNKDQYHSDLNLSTGLVTL